MEVGVRKGRTGSGSEIKGRSRISEHITSMRGCMWVSSPGIGTSEKGYTHPCMCGWVCKTTPQAQGWEFALEKLFPQGSSFVFPPSEAVCLLCAHADWASNLPPPRLMSQPHADSSYRCFLKSYEQLLRGLDKYGPPEAPFSDADLGGLWGMGM